MNRFLACPECGNENTTVYAQGTGIRHITCYLCEAAIAVPDESPAEMVFGKYDEKDLVEMLVAVGLLTVYPETVAYVSQLQKDLEAAISRLDVSAKETA